MKRRGFIGLLLGVFLLQYHGRRVCLAKKPRCPECTINSLCPYPEKTTSH